MTGLHTKHKSNLLTFISLVSASAPLEASIYADSRGWVSYEVSLRVRVRVKVKHIKIQD